MPWRTLERKLNYESLSPDQRDSLEDASQLTAASTFFFNTVETGDNPLGAAGFLSKSSSVTFAKGHSNYEYRGDDYEIDKFSSGQIRMVFADRIILSAHANYNSQHYKFTTLTQTSTFKSGFKGWGFGVGSYIGDNAAITLNLDQWGASSYGSFGSLADHVHVDYNHLFPLANNSALALTTSIGRIEFGSEDGMTELIGLDWFITPKISVGAEIDAMQLDDFDNYTLSFKGEIAFTENIALSTRYGLETDSYSGEFSSAEDDDTKHLEVGLTLRF